MATRRRRREAVPSFTTEEVDVSSLAQRCLLTTGFGIYADPLTGLVLPTATVEANHRPDVADLFRVLRSEPAPIADISHKISAVQNDHYSYPHLLIDYRMHSPAACEWSVLLPITAEVSIVYREIIRRERLSLLFAPITLVINMAEMARSSLLVPVHAGDLVDVFRAIGFAL